MFEIVCVIPKKSKREPAFTGLLLVTIVVEHGKSARVLSPFCNERYENYRRGTRNQRGTVALQGVDSHGHCEAAGRRDTQLIDRC